MGSPPTPITGLDHLGVQAPCIALYGELLPGLTNVTDRARYYSFYPWLVRCFERRYGDHSREAFARVLRRAECLLALAASFHELQTEEEDREHGFAAIGRNTLLAVAQEVLEGASVDLDTYARFEGPHRYFKNRLGGLGQYYFGPLRDLGVLGYVDDDPRNPPGYDSKIAAPLADGFSQSVDEDLFFRILESGKVTKKSLSRLARFCPCALRDSESEQNALLDMCFARTEIWQEASWNSRRVSLALLLDLADRQADDDDWSLPDLLRACAYSGATPDGRPWDVPDAWRRTRDGWGVYQRNELLSVALQALFWSTLQAIAVQSGSVPSAAEAGRLARKLVLRGVGKGHARLTVEQATDLLGRRLPDRLHYRDASHEISRAWDLVERTRTTVPDRKDLEAVAGDSVLLILSLFARGLRDYPYEEFELDPDYFARDDVHLLSLRQRSTEWAAWPFPEWVEWLATRWGVERHLQVALRKLRSDGRDTFRIRPLDAELRLVEIPPVVFTSPRVAQAVQVLRDLNLLTVTLRGTKPVNP